MTANPAMPPAARHDRDIWTISRLNREARAVLEGSFPRLWVQGELSNVAQPSSGHLYFSLKDEAAQVRGAMFRPKPMRLRFRPANGQQVLARGRISLYDPRGDFQLIVEHMELAGEGLWRLEIERLKQRLAAEGLFAEGSKRPLPAFPRQVGLVTSPSGAALRDLLIVLARRLSALPVVIYPVAVQGDTAAAEIAAALALAGYRGECDILILARGGGADEDLMAFNDERVVRAIRSAPIPVVTGIGHEIDITLADLAADRRAATPSAAAELVCPSAAHLSHQLAALRQRLATAVGRISATGRQRLDAITRHLRLVHPAARLRQRAQGLDELERRLAMAIQARIATAARRQTKAADRLAACSPGPRLAPLRWRAEAMAERLAGAFKARLDGRRHRLVELARGLDALSPLATLARGYAVMTRLPDGALLRRASDAPVGTRIAARLAQGRLVCLVEEASSDDLAESS